MYEAKETDGGLAPRHAEDATADEVGILLQGLLGPSRASVTRGSSRPSSRLCTFRGRRLSGDISVSGAVRRAGHQDRMPILYENPQEVGADRIVNAVAAFEKYGGPCIVV